MGKHTVTASDTAKQQLAKHFKSGDKALIRRFRRIVE